MYAILRKKWLFVVIICSLWMISGSSASNADFMPVQATYLRGISITQFGAKSVETEKNFNSTIAIQKAIDEAIAKQLPLIIPEGVFEVDSGVLRAVVPANHSLEIIGAGKKSVIRRRSASISQDFQDMLTITSSGGNVKQVVLKQFSLDGNAAGNPLPAGNTDPYLWQHCSGIRLVGAGADARINRVMIENLWMYDPVADHIYFPGEGDSFVDAVSIRNVYAFDRNRTRSDITVTGELQQLSVSNSVLTRLEVELNQPADSLFKMNVSNVKLTQALDIAGDHMEFYGDHIVAAHIRLWKVKGQIRDSELHFQKDVMPPRIDQAYSFQFINTSFYYPVASDGKVYPLTLDYTYHLIFESCHFIIDSGRSNNSMIQGRAIATKARTDLSETRILEIRNSKFDPRFSENLYLDRSGSVILVNNVYSGSETAIYMSGTLQSPLDVLIEGGKFKHGMSSPITFGAVEGLTLTMKDVNTPTGGSVYGF